jgi:hypothetical protein
MLPEDAPFLQKPFTPDQVVERVSRLLPKTARQD